VRASEVSIANRSGVTQKVWIFDSDASPPRSLTLVHNTSGSLPLQNQHSYYLYSVGFGKVLEWNSSNPEERVDPEGLEALLVDVDAYPRSEIRWEVVSWFPSEIIQGHDRGAPATFTIDTN
jgi:hypothetical protein